MKQQNCNKLENIVILFAILVNMLQEILKYTAKLTVCVLIILG